MRGCGERKPSFTEWEFKLVWPLRKSAQRILKLEIDLWYDPATALKGHMSKGLDSLPHRYLLSHLHCCSICKIPETETTKMTFNWLIDNERKFSIYTQYNNIQLLKNKNIRFAYKWIKLEKVVFILILSSLVLCLMAWGCQIPWNRHYRQLWNPCGCWELNLVLWNSQCSWVNCLGRVTRYGLVRGGEFLGVRFQKPTPFPLSFLCLLLV